MLVFSQKIPNLFKGLFVFLNKFARRDFLCYRGAFVMSCKTNKYAKSVRADLLQITIMTLVLDIVHNMICKWFIPLKINLPAYDSPVKQNYDLINIILNCDLNISEHALFS